MQITAKIVAEVDIVDLANQLKRYFISGYDFDLSKESDWLLFEQQLKYIRDRYIQKDERCETCDGSGEVHSHNPTCWTCNGTGHKKDKESQ